MQAIKNIKETPSPYLEIVFVGQCEVFDGLAFWPFSFLFFSSLAAKLIGPLTGCQFFK